MHGSIASALTAGLPCCTLTQRCSSSLGDFLLKQGLARLLTLASNLWSSCLSLRYWNYRCVTPWQSSRVLMGKESRWGRDRGEREEGRKPTEVALSVRMLPGLALLPEFHPQNLQWKDRINAKSCPFTSTQTLCDMCEPALTHSTHTSLTHHMHSPFTHTHIFHTRLTFSLHSLSLFTFSLHSLFTCSSHTHSLFLTVHLLSIFTSHTPHSLSTSSLLASSGLSLAPVFYCYSKKQVEKKDIIQSLPNQIQLIPPSNFWKS